MNERARRTIGLTVGGMVLALVLGTGLAPAAAHVDGTRPAPRTFNDNACIVREGYNITRIIDGVRWSLYAWKAYPGQICYSTMWVRTG